MQIRSLTQRLSVTKDKKALRDEQHTILSATLVILSRCLSDRVLHVFFASLPLLYAALSYPPIAVEDEEVESCAQKRIRGLLACLRDTSLNSEGHAVCCKYV